MLPRTQEAEMWGSMTRLEASLVYIVSSRAARDTDSVSVRGEWGTVGERDLSLIEAVISFHPCILRCYPDRSGTVW